MSEENQEAHLTCKEKIQAFLGKRVKYKHLVWVFFFVNLLNYVERSIIPGSAVRIEEFIAKQLPGSPDTFLGLLQSAFILGFSIACIVFGYFVSSRNPFRTVCIGLCFWSVAALFSGLAWDYWSLLTARLLSGVGEAAFQIVVPTFIDDYSPRILVGSSISRLYMAIPVGSAVGYTLAGFVGEHYSWRIIFVVSVPLMIPFVLLLHFFPISSLRETESSKDVQKTLSDENACLPRQRSESASIKGPLRVMLTTPSFILAVLGEAIAVFISTGFTSFGTIFLLNLNMFETESISSLVIGVLGCCAGVVGASIGGYTLDSILRLRDSFSYLYNYYCHLFLFTLVSELICRFSLIAMVCFCINAFCIGNRIAFLTLLFFGCTAVFAANPSWTLTILKTSPPSIRSLAVGIATILYHIFGDVPAPILIGKCIDEFVRGKTGEERYRGYSIVLQLLMLCSVLMVESRGGDHR